jgi:two-component system, OmpR family, sensor kinase
MRRFPTSVRTRLTLWYTVALALPLVAFAIASYLIFSHTVRARTDAFVGDALTVFARELGAERRAGPTTGAGIQRTLREVRFREVDIVILDDSGVVVGMSAPLTGATRRPGSPAALDPSKLVAGLGPIPPGSGRTGTVYRDGQAYRVLVRPLTAGGRTFLLAGVHPLVDVEEMLRRIRGLFLITIPLIIACAATAGWFLAVRSFRPVSAMAARAAEIGASTLNERLPIVANDELGELARVLNHLLDRLERSFEQQRRFMTDASHELRTPTAIVRTEADVTLSRQQRPEQEYRASMAIVQDASRRLTRIVDDVFLIARADAGHLVMNPGPLYLDELVRDTVRTVKAIADERRVGVALRDMVDAPLFGDADLLDRLILNLLDNAIKHSPEGGTIDVSMTLRDSVCDLSVVDAGPGIPPEAQPRVFERFFRVDVARSREDSTLTSGAGLGLSICSRIAEIHGGSLALVSSRPGRTEFRVSLPMRLPRSPILPAPLPSS